MVWSGVTIRSAHLGAVCALTLSCALAVPARAGQDSSGTTSNKSTTAKKSGSSSALKTSSRSPGVKKTSSKTPGKKSRRKSRLRGQQKIDSERAQAIQEALIREHYLSGEPTGTWNPASEEAMRRYQADHGWQSKTVPDSRALISLGLGPSKDHLLNPESAMTTVPDRPKAQPTPPTSHTAPATAEPVPPTSAMPAPVSTTPTPSESSSPQ